MSYSEELFPEIREEPEMPGTQHHQLSLEMGRFNGQVYVSYSSEESKSASEESSDEQHSGRDSQRPALK